MSDFSDGLKLIKLVEVLSRKSVGKFNRKVAFRSQKLENVSVALKFLQEREGIKLVTIGELLGIPFRRTDQERSEMKLPKLMTAFGA